MPPAALTTDRAGAPRRALVALVALAAALVVAGCGGEASNPEDATPAAPDFPFEVELSGVTVTLSDATYDLALPIDVTVDRNGRLYVVDRRSRHIVVVGPEGEVEGTIGRNGEGPGEFRVLIGAQARGENLYVLDNVHGVQLFDLEGTYLSAYDTPRIFSDMDITTDGGVIYSNNGVYSTSAQVARIGPGGAELTPVGAIVMPDAEPMGLRGVADTVAEGSIPDVLRNHTMPIAGPGGSIWAVSPTESLLRHYASSGELLSEASIEIPELPAIQEQYFSDFAASAGGDLFFFPNHVEDGVADDDGLLLLWSTLEGEPGLITVHDAEGAIIQRLLLPEITDGGSGTMTLRMAYDESRRRLYISASGTATIYAVELPDTVRF